MLLRTLGLLGLWTATVSAASLDEGFRHPPAETKPWCYWYWISDNISREGITRDLEAMAQVGIGEALMGNIFLDDIPAGKIKVLSPPWWALVEHAIREGGRVGVNVGLFNCPGWSQSGGPWITPERSMRYLVSAELRVRGPRRLVQKIDPPKTPFQDVSIVAFPAPQQDADALRSHGPRLTSRPPLADLNKLVDGDLQTSVALARDTQIEIELPQPIVARSLSLVPGATAWAAKGELLAEGPDGRLQTIKSFKFDRSNMAAGVGPMPRGPVCVTFPATRARRFRLDLTGVSGQGGLAELDLSAAARVESFVEKQLGKMHPTPLPNWDSYLWPAEAEPDAPQLAIPVGAVVDLRANLAADGTLTWDVPPGDWVVVRTGMTPTGTRNAPASPEGQGLEVDKMNRAAAQFHFDAFIGQLLARMPAADRRAFRRVVADSYEMGSQNWTDGFAATFQQRYGYDPRPWLPTLTGRVVGSVQQSDRFLWDLRRLVADHIARDYVGGLRDLCRPHGLELWLENYGHWGFPAEFLQYGGQSDRIGGEFWATGNLGRIELRAASSCANTYGKQIVSAEAFTGGPPFQSVPAALKARGDWAFCEGINHFVLHVNIHQPDEQRRPGVNAWFGTEFNRHNTWFADSRAWVDYLRRCCYLLQQGTRVADVAYYIGDDTPKMTGALRPERPPGCDFDFINAEVILGGLEVRNGRLVLPHGVSYAALVLPELETMRPEVLRKIVALSQAGATVVGPAPSRSPSLEGYPQCDAEVKRLAAQLRTQPSLAVEPDFRSERPLLLTHRAAGDTQIYFVANPQSQAVSTTAAFRVTGRAPELWCPQTGRISQPLVYNEVDGATCLPLHLGPLGSTFVVFRQPAQVDRVVRVTRDGQTLLDATRLPAATGEAPPPPSNFTIALWVKPAAETTLPAETDTGVHGLRDARNDVVFPAHGGSLGAGQHAGCGFAVGTNGLAVFEHGASYFAPLLVHATPLADWTHVAIVYRAGRPELYLNGTLAHRGLQSRHVVHPPAAAEAKFRGQIGGFQVLAQALDAAAVAQLQKASPRPGERAMTPTLDLSRDGIWAAQPGDYLLHAASGATRRLTVSEIPAAVEIGGPWEVQFGPQRVTFSTLDDWSTRPEEALRHYSGKALYRRTFDVPRGLGDGRRLLLDLGRVHDLAHVRVNGQDLGTLWMAPWQIDVGPALHAGANVLEIEVVNAWNNRLVGDRDLPVEKRTTTLSKDTLPPKAPLLPAGLLGPVRLHALPRFSVPQ